MQPLDELYSTRLLVFIEEEPQSNQYRQVILNKEQFKKVSDAVITIEKEKDEHGMEMVSFKHSEELYELPDLIEINYEA